MPIGDLYVAEYLLQRSRADSAEVRWTRCDDQSFLAVVNGVEITLGALHGSTSVHVALRFEHDGRTAYIQEPPSRGFFSRVYESEEEGRLAHCLRDLLREVSRLCARKEAERDRTGEKQALFQKLLFAVDPPSPTTAS